jgi:hypothetical protein
MWKFILELALCDYSDRLDRRLSKHDDDSPHKWDSYCSDQFASNLVTLLCQLIFTGECVIKVLAEGYNPSNYFKDKINGRCVW